MGTAGSTRRPDGGHGVASLRAGPRSLLLAGRDGGGPGRARGGPYRGAAASVRRVRTTGARAPRAHPLRPRRAGRGSSARRCDQVLRRRRPARRTRARRRGDPQPPRRGYAARADRGRLPVAGAAAGAPRHGIRLARDPVRPRGPHPAHADPLRPGPRGPASLRVARRRAARALRLPAHSLRRPSPHPRRLRRGEVARPRDPHPGARPRGDREPQRGARDGPRAGQGGRDAARGGAQPLEVDASRRVRARCLRGRRDVPAGPARLRHGGAAGRRAGGVGRAGRDARARRRRRGARAGDRAPRSARGAGARRRARPDAGPHPEVRRRLRARARGGQPPEARAGLAVPRRGAASHPRLCEAAAPRSGLPRALPLLHGLHAGAGAALPRARGRHRRGQPTRAEPVLGGGARRLPGRRHRPLDTPPCAVGPDLAGRDRAERARAAPCGRGALAGGPGEPPRRSQPGTAGSVGSSVPAARSSGRRGS